MVFAALVVFVGLIALVWLAVMRSLKDEGIPVRATLDETGTIRKWSAQREREQEEHVAVKKRLGRAKDRSAAQTWDPEL